MTFSSFWLMIVSRAMAVLPVLRSPMISSRWPRPIGVMASMALSRSAAACFTGCRSAMPGARLSTSRDWSVRIGPLPSSGLPSGSTTRPIIASPTGTREQFAGRADLIALADLQVVAEDDDGDRRFFEVERQTLDVGFGEIDHFAGHDVGQAVEAGDAVADFQHPAGLARLRASRRSRRSDPR